jgi:hypothetical protein
MSVSRQLKSKIGPPTTMRQKTTPHESCSTRCTTHRGTEFASIFGRGFFLAAASGSLDGRTRSTQPAPGSFRELTSFQTYSRGLCSFADRSFTSPGKSLAFPFDNMNRAASAKSLLRPIGFRCDSPQGRPDRLCQTSQKCRVLSVVSCACFHMLAPFQCLDALLSKNRGRAAFLWILIRFS